MLTILLLAFASLATAQVSVHDPNYCYSTDPIRPQRQMFAFNGHYDDVRGNALSSPLSTCTPIRSWIFSRGGMRLPSSNTINTLRNRAGPISSRVNRAIELGRSQLCRPDADSIFQWTFNASITNERENELVSTGWGELRNLASRLQTAFPQIFPSTYTEAQFRFRHTYRERTADSARAFAQGLFGHTDIVLDDIPHLDRLLRPIDTCRLYDEWSNNFGERNGFREGPDFINMMEEVNRKLGLRGSEQLSTPELLTLADYCRYEQGWDLESLSPWCGAFSIANHQILEYNVDLQTYYTSGYGGDESLFRNMNCHSIQDLLEFIQSNRTNEHLSRVFITHGNIISLFLVSLGAFRDDIPLTRHNLAQKFEREWHTSRSSPMARNFVLVQHDCAGEDNDLVIYFNERPLIIPGCEAPGVCKQATFVRLFERFLNVDCDEMYCSRN